MAAEKISIHKRIEFHDVWWPGVLDVLVKRFKLEFDLAEKQVMDFRKRFTRLLNLYWYLHPELSKEDNRIAAAVCECHGADSVTLAHARKVGLFNFDQAIGLYPVFGKPRTDNTGPACRPKVEVRFFGKTLSFSGVWSALFFQSLVFLFAILVNAVGLGLLLYSLAVFLLFIQNPVAVTAAATRSGSLAVSLLAFLMSLAILFRRAIVNIIRDVRRNLRRLEKKGS